MNYTSKKDMQGLLQQQRMSFQKSGFPPLEVRVDRLDRLTSMIKKYDREICDTIAKDYGTRSFEISRLTEVFVTIDQAKHAILSISEWMQPEQRQAPSPTNEGRRRSTLST